MSSDVDVDTPCDMCMKRSCYGCDYENEYEWDEDLYSDVEDHDKGMCLE